MKVLRWLAKWLREEAVQAVGNGQTNLLDGGWLLACMSWPAEKKERRYSEVWTKDCITWVLLFMFSLLVKVKVLRVPFRGVSDVERLLLFCTPFIS